VILVCSLVQSPSFDISSVLWVPGTCGTERKSGSDDF